MGRAHDGSGLQLGPTPQTVESPDLTFTACRVTAELEDLPDRVALERLLVEPLVRAVTSPAR